MSDGNGHPYSWAAIFNGYNYEEMKYCPFQVIPEYLEKEAYPEKFLLNYGQVTHIWTQDQKISKQIAKASKISRICENFEEMIGEIDALLLAETMQKTILSLPISSYPLEFQYILTSRLL